MQRIEIRRVSRDGRSIQTTTIFCGGPNHEEVEKAQKAFEAVMTQGRKERRWLLAFGAVVLTLETLILTLWR